jgi:hypothetical protein
MVTEMSDPRPWISILMGFVILGADPAWLVIGKSCMYTSWLVLGVVIFLASLGWLGMDFP